MGCRARVRIRHKVVDRLGWREGAKARGRAPRNRTQTGARTAWLGARGLDDSNRPEASQDRSQGQRQGRSGPGQGRVAGPGPGTGPGSGPEPGPGPGPGPGLGPGSGPCRPRPRPKRQGQGQGQDFWPRALPAPTKRPLVPSAQRTGVRDQGSQGAVPGGPPNQVRGQVGV